MNVNGCAGLNLLLALPIDSVRKTRHCHNCHNRTGGDGGWGCRNAGLPGLRHSGGSVASVTRLSCALNR